jgi:hypothetical protein
MSLTKQQQNFKNGRIASAMDIDGWQKLSSRK